MARAEAGTGAIDGRVERLLGQMTLAEKIGQLTLVHVEPGELPGDLRAAVRAGKAGAVLDVVDVATVNELQRIAAHDSRLGIPLLVGRDVIHGFKSVLPIPLGQAATWNPDLVRHGARMAALAALSAGVDMEMVSTTYRDHLPGLLAAKRIDPRLLDDAVRNVLRVKLQFGLFERTATDPAAYPRVASAANLALARELATQSLVLLQNRNGVLPLASKSLRSLAVIGPLADDPYEQLGTWAPDGDPALSRTPLQAVRETVGARVTVRHVRAMATTRTLTTAGFAEAVAAASGSDAAVLFLGEESILSGESHSRASIDLPGNQRDLVRAVKRAGRPVIVVILAGRPLTIEPILADADAVLYAWHPGVKGELPAHRRDRGADAAGGPEERVPVPGPGLRAAV
jgi:hypothetical protein